MSTNRSRRIDRDTAEQLLGGGTVGSEAGQASLTGQTALAELLAAARTPAAPAAGGALPGEEQAMAAFRAARHSYAPQHQTAQHRRRKMTDTALARAFSAKALAAALAVTTVGGVAVAASTGKLPSVLGGGGGNDSHVVSAPTARSSHSSGASAGTTGGASGRPGLQASGSAKPSSGATEGSGEPTAGTSTGASAAPSDLPDLAKLCRVFTDRMNGGAKAKDLASDQTLQPLVKVAGGADRIAAYCATVPGKDNSQPGSHDKPTPTPDPSKTVRDTKSPEPSLAQKSGGSGSGG